MKTLLVMILALSNVVYASETKIFETLNYRYEDHNVEFKVNKELGRAWVELSLIDRSFDDIRYDDHRIKIEGLSYDAATQKVLLEKDGQIIECGELRRIPWSIGRRVFPTKACSFKGKTVKVAYDDGFEIKYKPVFQLYMIVE